MAPKTVEELRNVISVSLGEAIEIIKQHIENTTPEDSSTICLIGPTGCGKTEAIGQITAEAKPFGFKKPGMSLHTRHLSQVHPLDMAGVGLDNQNKQMYYAEPPLHAEVLKTPAPRLVFLDEIDRAQPMAQSAMLQFILSGELNGFKTDNTWRVAAMNAWHAQYTYELDKAAASRLMLLSINPMKRDWMRWAAGNGIHIAILLTIESCPDVLNEHSGFDSGKDGKSTGNNDGALKIADPRAWVHLSKALKAGMDIEYAGAFVGISAAKKLQLYAKIQQDYRKEIQQVLDGKKVTINKPDMDITERNRTLFCVYLAAAAQIKANDIPTARAFLKNGSEQMDKERCYVASRLITYTTPSQVLCKDPEIQKIHLEMVDEIEGHK